MMRKIVNPFIYIAGGRALLLGLSGIVLSAVFGWMSNSHFDGIFDVHFTEEKAFHVHLLAGMINWIVLCFALAIPAVLLSRARFRLIDLIGTLAMARMPYLLSTFIPYIYDPSRIEDIFMNGVVMESADMLGMAALFAVSFLVIVWSITWTYQAYSHVANLKGTRAVAGFITAMIGAAIIDKILLAYLLGYTFLPL